MTQFYNYLNEMGAGWDKSSIKKMGNSIGKDPDEHGFFDACVKKMSGEIDNPQAFCANLIDEFKGHTKWRTGRKSKKEK